MRWLALLGILATAGCGGTPAVVGKWIHEHKTNGVVDPGDSSFVTFMADGTFRDGMVEVWKLERVGKYRVSGNKIYFFDNRWDYDPVREREAKMRSPLPDTVMTIDRLSLSELTLRIKIPGVHPDIVINYRRADNL